MSIKIISKKIILILLVLFICFIFGFIVYKFYNKNNVIITGENEQKIKITNIFNNKYTITNKSIVTLTEKANVYDIIEYIPNNTFYITIYSKDRESGRIEAENNLLTILNVNKEEACKLKVTLSLPLVPGAEETLINYGLSFCPNSIAFPK